MGMGSNFSFLILTTGRRHPILLKQDGFETIIWNHKLWTLKNHANSAKYL